MHLLGDSWSSSNTTRTCPFQTVDQTALPHVRKTYQKGVGKHFTLDIKSKTEPRVLLDDALTYNTYSDGGLYVQIAAVVAEVFHQAICTNTSAAVKKLSGGLCHRYVAAFLSEMK